jgi:hypothetical protein
MVISSPLFYPKYMVIRPSRNRTSRALIVSRISLILLFFVSINGVSNTIFIAKAQAVQTRQIVKKPQTISVRYPQKVSVINSYFSITDSDTSGQPITVTSISPTICSNKKNAILPLVPGKCLIRLSQKGNAKFLSASAKNITILIQGANVISFTPAVSLPLSSGTYLFMGSSTTGLPVSYESTTPDICAVSGSTLTLIKLGTCIITGSQSGSNIYSAALPVNASIMIQGNNQISFTLPSSLLLSTKIYSLTGISTSALAVNYESLTPNICSVSATILTVINLGVCTVRASQIGSDIYPVAQTVEASVTISDTRASGDQPDTISGFQIHAIYVVPADGTDHFYDTSGYIAGILDEGNNFLRSQIGFTVPIDRTAIGYDIQFMKSNLTTAEIKSSNDLSIKLLTDGEILDSPGSNRKDYIFFIDVNILGNGTACGSANAPGMSAVVAIGDTASPSGPRCTGNYLNFVNYASKSWPHELFHNFGVNHTLDSPCDLMSGAETPGICPQNGTITIDKEKTRYIGSSAQGEDIMKLRVWDGHTDQQNLQANCSLNPVPRADGINYAYCPTGTQTIGALTNCWNPINSVSLEEFVNGKWTSLGSGGSDPDPWGPNVSWKCSASFTAPWKQLTVTTPGISLYRWMVNGSESEQFKVIWVR